MKSFYARMCLSIVVMFMATSAVVSTSPQPCGKFTMEELGGDYLYPTVWQRCYCGNSQAANFFPVTPGVKPCVNTCMQGNVGKPCYWKTAYNAITDYFKNCCSSCSGKLEQLTVRRTPSQWKMLGCTTTTPTPTPSPTPQPAYCGSITMEDFGGDYPYPTVWQRCYCGNAMSARPFAVANEKETCVRTCMTGYIGKKCHWKTGYELITGHFKNCCAICAGKIGEVPAGPPPSQWKMMACLV